MKINLSVTKSFHLQIEYNLNVVTTAKALHIDQRNRSQKD